jgi:hypothetical protein
MSRTRGSVRTNTPVWSRQASPWNEKNRSGADAPQTYSVPGSEGADTASPTSADFTKEYSNTKGSRDRRGTTSALLRRSSMGIVFSEEVFD